MKGDLGGGRKEKAEGRREDGNEGLGRVAGSSEGEWVAGNFSN